jgi:hypothetical protein
MEPVSAPYQGTTLKSREEALEAELCVHVRLVGLELALLRTERIANHS